MTALLLILVGTVTAPAAEPPRAPQTVTVEDRPNDAGTGLKVTWELSPDDTPDQQPRKVLEYHVYREVDGERAAEPVAVMPAGNTQFDDGDCSSKSAYRYFVQAVGPD
ncbi:MAG: hypothetical protein B7Z55_18595, partial [Planctomycetales bacterium 12-60-4]